MICSLRHPLKRKSGWVYRDINVFHKASKKKKRTPMHESLHKADSLQRRVLQNTLFFVAHLLLELFECRSARALQYEIGLPAQQVPDAHSSGSTITPAIRASNHEECLGRFMVLSVRLWAQCWRCKGKSSSARPRCGSSAGRCG